MLHRSKKSSYLKFVPENGLCWRGFGCHSVLANARREERTRSTSAAVFKREQANPSRKSTVACSKDPKNDSMDTKNWLFLKLSQFFTRLHGKVRKKSVAIS